MGNTTITYFRPTHGTGRKNSYIISKGNESKNTLSLPPPLSLSLSLSQRVDCKIRNDTDYFTTEQSKEEGKDQENIQSNTTPGPGHHMEKCQKHKKTSHTREPRGHSFPNG